MKKFANKFAATVLALLMILTQFSVLPAFAAEGDPVLEMAIAHKIDVALAVGPTTVDYSKFEADLREDLRGREHPVPDADLYIMASQAVSASTTSEFSWWTYDHTRPSSDGYGGIANISDVSHMYSELSAAATSTASATNLQNGSGVNYAPGIWGPGNPTSASTIVNTVGAANYVPGIGYQYADVNKAPNYYPIDKFELNPDPTNPDLSNYNTANTRRLRHPYLGNNTHMASSNNGATMDFYGYPQNAYRDWQFLPNDQKTLKTFEFSIAEDRAFDALDGVGFFFNTEVNGSYAAGAQTMSGYLLFLQYASGVGTNMTIYKFKDINTKDFHHTVTGATSSSAEYTIAGYNGTTNATSTTYTPKFVPVARSTIYTSTDFSRRIRVEASPTQVKVYYNGSAGRNDAAVLDPAVPGYIELTESKLVNFTTATLSVTGLGTVSLQTGSTILMDASYIGSNTDNDADYGFGPMAAYLAHGCARPTHIAMQNLTMTVEKVKSLTEVVREPEWHENTYKYLVNLNENEIADFETNAIIAELLARLTNDDIYYVGWGSTINAIASSAFLRKHSLKGTIIDIKGKTELYATPEWIALDTETQASYEACILEALTYDAQIKAIADEIYERYWSSDASNHALVSDNVIMSVTGADMQNTADAEWPSGKWKIVHLTDIAEIEEMYAATGDENPLKIGDNTYMTNFMGQYANSDQYMDDLETSYNFPLPGLYLIYYRVFQIGTLVVHRPPVAGFDVTLVDDKPDFLNTSYDPDVYEPGGINEDERGIKEEQWSWIDLDDPLMLTAEPGVPSTLEEGHSYIVTLMVWDDWDVAASISKLVTYSDAESTEILPPFADFTLTPVSYIKTSDPEAQAAQKITLTNKSYDPAGRPIDSVWTVYKDDVLYGGLSISDGDFTGKAAEYTVGGLPAGRYKVELIVTNNGDVESASVAKFFDIIEDLIPPAASISQTAPQSFTGNATMTLSFTDTGGSGFKEGRFAIVTVDVGAPVPSAPAPGGPEWKATSPTAARSVLISVAGDNYVFWEAWDNSGNYNSGRFGPYTMNKKPATLSLNAEPQDGNAVVYGAAGKGVTLTASITVDDPMPTGTVIFYQGSTLLGSGTINSSGVAAWTGNPAYAGDLADDFKAVYQGDANYNTATATATCEVERNPAVTVTIGAQTNREYDATVYAPTGISVAPTIAIKIVYEGRNNTSYGPSTFPPADAGEYTATVVTDDSNYEEKTDSANFQILPRGLTLTLAPDAAHIGGSEALSTVTLTATVGNAKDLPPGTLEFWANDGSDATLIAALSINTADESDYDAVENLYTYNIVAEWSDMISGEYTLTLTYIPEDTDNYTAADYVIEDYDIEKLDQAINFTDTSPIGKIFGDANFYVEATGGMTAGTITYSVVSGSGVLSVDSSGEVIILGAGTATIRAFKPGDASYNSATADIFVNVGKKSGYFTVSLDEPPVFGDSFAPAVTNESGGTATYIYEGINGTEYGPSDIPPTAAGEYTVTATAAETANYLSVSDSASFSILPCECDVTGVLFDGAAINIPYFSVQSNCILTAEADFESCGRSEHNYSFTYDYKIISAPAGSAVIDQAAGRLIVNDKADGYTITVEVTATHTPTGHTGVSYAVFTVTKEAKPAGSPVTEGAGGTGIVDKNDYDEGGDSTVVQDISSVYTPGVTGKPTVTYNKGPDKNTGLVGKALTEGVDYELGDGGMIVFSPDFIDSLYAVYDGDEYHEISIAVDGVELVFHLYVAPGALFAGVSIDTAANPPLPAVKNDIGELKGELKDSEEQKPENIEDMDKGYDVYIDLVVSQAGVTPEGAIESALIETSAGFLKKQICHPFIDIALIKTMRGKAENIKEAEEPIRLIIDIPESIRGMRNYVVARVHTPASGEPEFEPLDTILSGDGTQLFFSSAKFSTFAILYDKKIVDDRIYDESDASGNGSGGSAVNPVNAATGQVTVPGPDDETTGGNGSGGQNGFAGVSDRIREMLETGEAGDHIAYINGYDDGTVSPDGAITRAEVAAVFFRLLKNPVKNDAVSGSFTDVPSGSWYAQAVNYLAQSGILDGYKDGSFKPNQNITRAEFATIASRFDHYEGEMNNPFADVTVNHWAYESILSAFSNGWVSGYTDGEFRPQTNITRGEVVVIVNRILGRRLEIGDVPEGLYSLYSDLTPTHWAFPDIIEASVAHEYETKPDGYELWIVTP